MQLPNNHSHRDKEKPDISKYGRILIAVFG